MKIVTSIALLAAALSDPGSDAQRLPVAGQPAYEKPAQPWTDVEDAAARQDCRDRIEQVRKDVGKPRIERAPADAAKPILQYAVDRRIDGCGVLVPVADPAAVMPPPEVGEPEVIPATLARVRRPVRARR